MRDYREIFRSKTGTINEALSPDVFVTDARPEVSKGDKLFVRGLVM